MSGWVLDKSASSRAADPAVAASLRSLRAPLAICEVGELEQLYSARSARHYDGVRRDLHARFDVLAAPPDLLGRSLRLQHDLAHHHGMWHRIPIPDLLIAETALHHGCGVAHLDGDFDRIAEVRPLAVHRVRA